MSSGRRRKNRPVQARSGLATPAKELQTIFVIGPIGSELAPIGSREREVYESGLATYTRVIQAACEVAGYLAVRADQIPRAGEIPEQVMKHLRDDRIVIADVTDGNPNVMYELGIRHTTGKCTLLIGEYGRLPFDIAAIRAVQFVRTANGYIDGRDRLVVAIRAAARDGCDPTTAARVLGALLDRPSQQASAAVEVLLPTSQIPSAGDADQPGFLEILADTEQAFPELKATLEALTQLMSEAGELAAASAREIGEGDARGAGATAKLLVVRKFAAAFAPLSERAEELAAKYERELRTIDGGVTYLLNRMEAEPELVATSGDFPSSLISWSDMATDLNARLDQLASSIDTTAAADRQMRIPLGRYASSLRSVRKSSTVISAWADRMREMLDAKRVRGGRKSKARGRSAKLAPGVQPA